MNLLYCIVFIYLPHNNYKKNAKKNVGRNGEEA